jgi:squalene synthase HpnC
MRGIQLDGLELAHSDQEVLEAIASRSGAQAGAENFPVALRVLPRGPRAHLSTVYAFARFVDDVGDEAMGDRSALLEVIESDVRSLATGTAQLLPVRSLGPVVDECDVPLQPFLDLVEANKMDQVVSHYPTFEDLLGYCRLSAAPIGLVVLHVAGAATEDNVAASDSVCAALQVLEHCQDVAEDARMGRVYLPAEELDAAGISADDLAAAHTSGRLRSVISVQVERALGLLAPGRGLVRNLSGWSRVAVSGYIAGGLATAAALRRADFDVLAKPIAPRKSTTAAYATRLMAGF